MTGLTLAGALRRADPALPGGSKPCEGQVGRSRGDAQSGLGPPLKRSFKGS
jgi:hypothetical protein